MNRKLALVVAFLTASLSSLVFAQAPVTDGLKWDTDMPKAFLVGKVGQIQLNGLVDATAYPNGGAVVAETIAYKIYAYDATTGRGAMLDEGTCGVAALTSWTGATVRRGGFPAGLYAVEFTTDKFRETAGAATTRIAILKKEPFEIK